jgi:hypothetical protein
MTAALVDLCSIYFHLLSFFCAHHKDTRVAVPLSSVGL